MGWEEQGQPDPAQDESDIQASIDESDPVPRFVIADTATDDAWIAIPYADAPFLYNWR